MGPFCRCPSPNSDAQSGVSASSSHCSSPTSLSSRFWLPPWCRFCQWRRWFDCVVGPAHAVHRLRRDLLTNGPGRRAPAPGGNTRAAGADAPAARLSQGVPGARRGGTGPGRPVRSRLPMADRSPAGSCVGHPAMGSQELGRCDSGRPTRIASRARHRARTPSGDCLSAAATWPRRRRGSGRRFNLRCLRGRRSTLGMDGGASVRPGRAGRPSHCFQRQHAELTCGPSARALRSWGGTGRPPSSSPRRS